jgi:hypothetical protein
MSKVAGSNFFSPNDDVAPIPLGLTFTLGQYSAHQSSGSAHVGELK